MFDPNQFEIDIINKVDDQVNTKMAQGMKMAINLIVNKFDIQLQKQLLLMVKDEIDNRINDIKEINLPTPKKSKRKITDMASLMKQVD